MSLSLSNYKRYLWSGHNRKGTKATVFAFGTRLSAEVDGGKLQCLRNMGYDVVSVNDASSFDNNHVCTNFKEVRGLPSIGQRITTETAKGNKVILVLDHSWLECNYYKERYGMNWLTKKASILLNYGASNRFCHATSMVKKRTCWQASTRMTSAFVLRCKIKRIRRSLPPPSISRLSTLQLKRMQAGEQMITRSPGNASSKSHVCVSRCTMRKWCYRNKKNVAR